MVDLKILPRELGIGDHDRRDRLSTRLAPHPKFRDPVSGDTWRGRGRAPAWIAG
ncbi:H-NS family nucleoid-associated regulatory protein [Paraburkholderia domus]|uniref:H-NS family nucleoid-associated regulatory protein n=1 Tax=Paraburkholderia domus TaxID=2793075 RepID=UPI001EF0AF94|nr:H-NS family nucleoid-associated regulatory protein [Paraburkholderia domus]